MVYWNRTSDSLVSVTLKVLQTMKRALFRRGQLYALGMRVVNRYFSMIFFLCECFFPFLKNCRGCLFYGPPGTGKTLVARALANECSQGDRRVAFFMRKGADCLSKWVGESERQLRLLFDQVQLKCALCSVWVVTNFVVKNNSLSCFANSFHWSGIINVSFFSKIFRGLKSWDALGKISEAVKRTLQSNVHLQLLA